MAVCVLHLTSWVWGEGGVGRKGRGGRRSVIRAIRLGRRGREEGGMGGEERREGGREGGREGRGESGEEEGRSYPGTMTVCVGFSLQCFEELSQMYMFVYTSTYHTTSCPRAGPSQVGGLRGRAGMLAAPHLSLSRFIVGCGKTFVTPFGPLILEILWCSYKTMPRHASLMMPPPPWKTLTTPLKLMYRNSTCTCTCMCNCSELCRHVCVAVSAFTAGVLLCYCCVGSGVGSWCLLMLVK